MGDERHVLGVGDSMGVSSEREEDCVSKRHAGSDRARGARGNFFLSLFGPLGGVLDTRARVERERERGKRFHQLFLIGLGHTDGWAS